MEKVGVLVVSYGAREAAMVDAFARSQDYKVELYVADRQRNPLNVERAAKHIVLPDLNIEEICRFAFSNSDRIDFGIVGPEKPIIEGVRDMVENVTGIPIICPTRRYALEASKVRQRLLFQEVAPEVNPRFKVFSRKEYQNLEETRKAVFSWLDDLNNQAVVKPDRPAAGKGVGVWGDHFFTREQLLDHFFADLEHGSVIIEEKVDGEESSFQAFCDGKHVVPLPDTRDYKRAFDGDKGPNTGGMGSYKDTGDVLPFTSETDRAREIEILEKIFRKWKVEDRTGLRGIPFYLAFMHTGKEPKILENNSRPGDPEILNILPILKDDLVDICFRILEGNLTQVRVEKQATVTGYKAPPDYGGYVDSFPDLVAKHESGSPVDLAKACDLNRKYGDRIRVYPASMETRDGKTYALKSRAVCVVGVGDSIEEARQISQEGLASIDGGGLWCRKDIASRQHIEKSLRHLSDLRLKR